MAYRRCSGNGMRAGAATQETTVEHRAADLPAHRATRIDPLATRRPRFVTTSAGLLRPSGRVGGRRIYEEEVFERLASIFLAQDAGFTIAETKEFLHGFEPAATASERWRAIGEQKIAELTQRIERAERMRWLLERPMRCQCRTLGERVRSEEKP
jgi:DNA-binding transcriptional MerR regulator